MVCRCFSKRRT